MEMFHAAMLVFTRRVLGDHFEKDPPPLPRCAPLINGVLTPFERLKVNGSLVIFHSINRSYIPPRLELIFRVGPHLGPRTPNLSLFVWLFFGWGFSHVLPHTSMTCVELHSRHTDNILSNLGWNTGVLRSLGSDCGGEEPSPSLAASAYCVVLDVLAGLPWDFADDLGHNFWWFWQVFLRGFFSCCKIWFFLLKDPTWLKIDPDLETLSCIISQKEIQRLGNLHVTSPWN